MGGYLVIQSVYGLPPWPPVLDVRFSCFAVVDFGDVRVFPLASIAKLAFPSPSNCLRALMGCAASSPAESPASSSGQPHATQLGDCLVVRDTHGIWATARVVALAQHARFGPLVLVHFEGWSSAWLMWLSPTHDAERVRCLSPSVPGVGSRGIHTAHTLDSVIREAHAKITSGGEWRKTSGGERTYPFQDAERMRISLSDAGAWRRAQPATRPFVSCRQLARDRGLCQSMLFSFRAISPQFDALPMANADSDGRAPADEASAPLASVPAGYRVYGSGVANANGLYVYSGQSYGGAPRFEKGQLWLLRYTLRSGNRYWYIADKDQLDRDDGDLYRVRASEQLPPQFGWKKAKDGVDPPPTLELLKTLGPPVDIPIVEAQLVDAVAPAVRAGSTVGSDSLAPLTLIEKVHHLKRELGLRQELNVNDAVHEAARQLGVDARERPLSVIATLCIEAVMPRV